MKENLDTLDKNGTWEIIAPLQGVKPILCKWVYRVKRKADGSVNKFKAKLVAKGFLQIFGHNYHELFSPVAKVVTVRLLLACVVHQRWHVHQMDINNTFLYGKLEEELYLHPPHKV